VERVALRLSQALNQHYDLGPVADDALVSMAGDLSEEAEYANESTVAGAELFSDLRQIALQVVRDTPPMPLRWRVYPSVLELKSEFLVHLERLRSAEATAQDRLVALMNLSRLQMTFLANTFC
jgi:hypothetical protein